jgi:hypothetical protein
MPPQWMETSYELNTRDVLAVLEQQILTTEFNGQFEYSPYQEYDSEGDRVYSNLMSGYWATREAVLEFLSYFILSERFLGHNCEGPNHPRFYACAGGCW